MFEVGHYSHAGNKRTLNEDTYDIDIVQGIACVVDGMGGANAGEYASRIAVEKIATLLPRSFHQSAQGMNAGFGTAHAIADQKQAGFRLNGVGIFILGSHLSHVTGNAPLKGKDHFIR